MNGWTLLLRLLVCGTGVVVFLHFVADRLASTRVSLLDLEKREELAWRKRQAEADADEGVLEIGADGVV